MARICIATAPGFSGHLTAALAFAKRLGDAGHHVQFAGLADDREAAVKRGFEYVSLLEDAYPAGSTKDRQARLAAAKGTRLLRALREETTRWEAACRDLGARIGMLKEHAWDVGIGDIQLPLASFMFQRLGVRHVVLQTALPITIRSAPHLTSSRLPAASLWGRVQEQADWLQRLALRRGRNALMRLVAGANPIAHLSRVFDVPASSMDVHGFRVPHLVACPKEFDFPLPSPSRFQYAEPMVDLSRADDPFDLPAAAAGKKLVYVALGTQSFRVRGPSTFLGKVLEAFRSASDTHVVIAAAESHDALAARGVPDNVTLLRFAPQLAILRRASAMVVHAGLNSIKECVLMGVPMVAFPKRFDQPGNAARVAFHKLGVMGDFDSVSASEIRRMVEEVHSPQYRNAVSSMRERFVEAATVQPGVRFIEQLAQGGPQ
jgi:zeaxanthin glucosyltransferase